MASERIAAKTIQSADLSLVTGATLRQAQPWHPAEERRRKQARFGAEAAELDMTPAKYGANRSVLRPE